MQPRQGESWWKLLSPERVVLSPCPRQRISAVFRKTVSKQFFGYDFVSFWGFGNFVGCAQDLAVFSEIWSARSLRGWEFFVFGIQPVGISCKGICGWCQRHMCFQGVQWLLFEECGGESCGGRVGICLCRCWSSLGELAVQCKVVFAVFQLLLKKSNTAGFRQPVAPCARCVFVLRDSHQRVFLGQPNKALGLGLGFAGRDVACGLGNPRMWFSWEDIAGGEVPVVLRRVILVLVLCQLTRGWGHGIAVSLVTSFDWGWN